MTAILAADAAGEALTGFTSWMTTPVHAAVLALLALLAYEGGRALTEAWRRVRPGSVGLERLTEGAMADPDVAEALARSAPGALAERTIVDLARAARDGGRDAIERALARYELGVQRRLDRTRLLVRAGPALGLMGTIIPLAPGLAALGDGDIETLAAELQIAFGATVTGIMIGMLAFWLTLWRTRVYTEDLAAFEHAVADRDPQAPPHHRVAQAVGEHAA